MNPLPANGWVGGRHAGDDVGRELPVVVALDAHADVARAEVRGDPHLEIGLSVAGAHGEEPVGAGHHAGGESHQALDRSPESAATVLRGPSGRAG